MTIKTAFTPEEIAAYMEANKTDHPTAKGIAGFPPRYVELEMILNQVERELGERKSPHRRIWDAMFGLLALCPPEQLDVARSWVAELVEANARLDSKFIMTGLIGKLGGPFKVADMIIEMRRIECETNPPAPRLLRPSDVPIDPTRLEEQLGQAETEWQYHVNSEVEAATKQQWDFSIKMGSLWRERSEELRQLIEARKGGAK